MSRLTLAGFALALLSCGGGGGGGDGAGGGPSTVLAVVEVDTTGGSGFAAQSMAVAFGARTPTDDFFAVPGFPVAELTSADDYTVWEAPTSDPLFATTAAALTDGVPSDSGFTTFGGLDSWFPETSPVFQILEPSAGVPDLSGRVVEKVVLVVDEVTINSPGSDPNGDGEWVDYSLRGRFVIYGR